MKGGIFAFTILIEKKENPVFATFGKRRAESFARFLLSCAGGKLHLLWKYFPLSACFHIARQCFILWPRPLLAQDNANSWTHERKIDKIMNFPKQPSFFAWLWLNHKKWITVELLGKFITGISIIYKWYSLLPLFHIKRISHPSALWSIISLDKPEMLLLMF